MNPGARIFFLILIFLTFSTKGRAQDEEYINTKQKPGYAIAGKLFSSSPMLLGETLNAPKNIEYTKELGLDYLKKGNEHTRKHQYNLSRFYYRLSLWTGISMHNDTLATRSYIAFGNSYTRSGDYDTAIYFYKKAIFLCEKLTSSNDTNKTEFAYNKLVRCHILMSSLYLKLLRWDKMFEHVETAEKIARERKDYVHLANVLLQKAEVYENRKEISRAVKVCEEAMELVHKYSTSKHHIGVIYHTLGNVYQSTDLVKAESYYEKALKLINTNQRSTALAPLGKIYMKRGKYAQAEPVLLEALQIATENQDTYQMFGIAYILARVYEGKGDYKKAYQYLMKYQLMFDKLMVGKNVKVREAENKYELAKKDNIITQNKLLIAKQNNDLLKNRFTTVTISIAICVLLLGGLAFYLHKRRLFATRLDAIKQEEKTNLLLSTIKGEEKERTRLAAELHDGIGGLLSTTKMYFTNLQKKEPGLADSPDYKEALTLLEETIVEVRKSAHNLMPEMLFNLGLPEAIRAYCSSIQRANEIKVYFQHYGFTERLDHNIELLLYRTVQELLQNIVKHSDATQALVQLSKHNNILSATIEDNGIGMKHDKSEAGMGLQTIKTRIQSLNGHFNIISKEGLGTSIYIEIELKPEPEQAA